MLSLSRRTLTSCENSFSERKRREIQPRCCAVRPHFSTKEIVLQRLFLEHFLVEQFVRLRSEKLKMQRTCCSLYTRAARWAAAAYDCMPMCIGSFSYTRSRLASLVRFLFDWMGTEFILVLECLSSWTISLLCLHGITRFFLIQKHGFSHHYFNDSQLYLSFHPDNLTIAARISACLTDISCWMKDHHLQLNLAKTELLVVPSNPSFHHNFTNQLGTSTINPSKTARNS